MIGLFLVIALFGFGAGYETHNATTEVGCDLVVRDMVADYKDKGYAPIDGTQFSNGFAIIFADGAKANIEQNIFADEAPPAEQVANWAVLDSCTTSQNQHLTRYVRAQTMTNEPTSDARGAL